MKPDYLIVGSGLSALVFGALMANNGRTVQVLEAHEHPGGFGHSFELAGKYRFNAQLHYVWDCGEGQTVSRVLKKLGLDQEVTFERYDPNALTICECRAMPSICPQSQRRLFGGSPHCFQRLARTFAGLLGL